MSPIHKASLIEASYHSKEVLELLDLDISRTLVGESLPPSRLLKFSSKSFFDQTIWSKRLRKWLTTLSADPPPPVEGLTGDPKSAPASRTSSRTSYAPRT